MVSEREGERYFGCLPSIKKQKQRGLCGRHAGEVSLCVAIKSLIPVAEKQALDANYQAFLSEINLMNKLRHPNIVLFLGACLEPPQ